MRDVNLAALCPAGHFSSRVISSQRLLAATLLLAAVSLLGGCRQPASADPKAPGTPKKLTIACIPKATASSYWASVRAGAERAGRELHVNVDWQGPLNDSKIADQIGIFNNLAASGVDGILLAPADDRALLPHVRSAIKRGLPVALFDSELDGKPGVDYIGLVATDNHRAGVVAAQTLLHAIGDAPAYGGKVIMIRLTEGSASSRRREEAFIETLAAATPKLQIVEAPFTDGTMAGAQRVTETLLNNYVKNKRLEVDGIFAASQTATEGAYTAIEALHDEKIESHAKFVGFDVSELLDPGLRNGTVTALVVQDTEKMGYLGVKLLIDHINQQPVETFVDTPVTVKTQPGGAVGEQPSR